MRSRHLIFVGAVAATVACVASERDPAPSSSWSAPEAPAPAPIARPAATPPASHPELRGPRVFDWTSSRVVGRSTNGVDPSQISPMYTSGQGPGFNVTTGAPVTADGAIYGASWTSSSSADLLFFGVNGSGATAGINGGAKTTAPTKNFFALNNLYLGGGSVPNDPAIVWSNALAGGVDSAPTLSQDGTKVYVAGTDGVFHCFLTSNGTACGGGWVDYATGCASGVHGSAPWIDYTTAQGDIYLADTCGYVHRIQGSGNTNPGKKQWAILAGAAAPTQAPIRSGPIAFNGFIYLGDDMGQIFRITDGLGASAPKTNSPSVVAIPTCAIVGKSAPCPGYVAGTPDTPSQWAVTASLAFDVTSNHAYAVANDYMFELNGGAGSWAQTPASPKQLGTGGVGPMYSAPGIDNASGYVYTALNGKLAKVAYPFSGSASSGVYLTAGSNLTSPVGAPLAYSGQTYLGDSKGFTEAFDCTTAAGVNGFEGSTPAAYGTSINTDLIIDYQNGDVSFGYASASGGGYAQFGLAIGPQAAPLFSCPAATPKLCGGVCAGGMGCQQCCTSTDCSGGKTCISGTCVATGCADASACPVLPNTTASCGDAGACTYACLPGFANCSGTIQTAGCPINTNTDVNNCGGCGVACSSNNLPVPVCASGICTGQCADGFVDCNGNRQIDGCESPTSCGSCCGVACTSGKTCYDTGGKGACVAGQKTMTSGVTAENGTATLACPAGQKIAALTFADYGTPGGSAAQSATPWNPLSCAANKSAATCGAAPGCSWNGATCVATCSTKSTAAACGVTAGCTWGGVGAQSACVPAPCSTYGTLAACNAAAGCNWNGASCVAYSCANAVGAAACGALPGCTFNAPTGTCTTTTCASLNAYSAGTNQADLCDQTKGCAWNAGSATCGDSCAPLTNACGSVAGCQWTKTNANGNVNACTTTGVCASLADQCDTTTNCTWTGGAAGSCSCASVGQAYCTAAKTPGCTWSATLGCTGTCTVGGVPATNACAANAACVWEGGLIGCNATACAGVADSCDTTSPCAWNGVAKTCANPTPCATRTNVCAAAGCSFDVGASSCTASTGFLHDYGSASSTISPNTFLPECALDVSQNASFIAACVTGSPTSCSMAAVNNTFGTGANTANGSTLPLTITAGPPANYPKNPCPTLPKRLYMEAQCGTCP